MIIQLNQCIDALGKDFNPAAAAAAAKTTAAEVVAVRLDNELLLRHERAINHCRWVSKYVDTRVIQI